MSARVVDGKRQTVVVLAHPAISDDEEEACIYEGLMLWPNVVDVYVDCSSTSTCFNLLKGML